MIEKSRLLQALRTGDARSLKSVEKAEIEDGLLNDDDVRLALYRTAEQVVFHRPGHRECVKALIALGADCDIWTAARAGLLEQVKAALKNQPELLNATDRNGRTPMQRASLIYGVCQQAEEVSDFLIAQGAKVDIFTASTFGLISDVKNELASQPNLVQTRCQGSAPLNWAVRPRRNFEKAPEICRALIDAGADLGDWDEDEAGMTPLHHAAEWGQPVCRQLITILLDAGADLNKLDDNGWTPLDYAMDRRRTELSEFLTGLGAITAANAAKSC